LFMIEANFPFPPQLIRNHLQERLPGTPGNCIWISLPFWSLVYEFAKLIFYNVSQSIKSLLK
jgi:hypothetical protein